MEPSYPKRLIEVDLPIKEIGKHSAREKNIRKGHIATLHTWWARRPLAACRAVLCAALWPDPADDNCPNSFKTFIKKELQLHYDPLSINNKINDRELRNLLLRFISDFANWDNAPKKKFIKIANKITAQAHLLFQNEGTQMPLVADPFACGGAIPFETIRIGAESHASDLNPLPILLNTCTNIFIPKYGDKLSSEFLKASKEIGDKTKLRLRKYYPKLNKNEEIIAYSWSRTYTCSGPSCGIEVPMLKQMWLSKQSKNDAAMRWVRDKDGNILVGANKKPKIELFKPKKASDVENGNVARGKATCPVCGYTASNDIIKKQMIEKNGGAKSSRLMAVRIQNLKTKRREYRLPVKEDHRAIELVEKDLYELTRDDYYRALLPNETTPKGGGSGASRAFSLHRYGIYKFNDLFNNRQLLSMLVLWKEIDRHLSRKKYNEFIKA